MPSRNLIIPFTFPFTLSLDSVHRGARWRGVNVGGVRPRSPAITSCSRDRRLVSFRFRSAHFSAGSSLSHALFTSLHDTRANNMARLFRSMRSSISTYPRLLASPSLSPSFFSRTQHAPHTHAHHLLIYIFQLYFYLLGNNNNK